MSRRAWLLFHRWVGLVIAGFLLLAGLTGGLIVWYHELDAVVAAELHHLPTRPAPPAQPTAPDRFDLRERVAAAYPKAWVNYVDLRPLEPGRSAVFFIEGAIPPGSREHRMLPNDEVFIDPLSGGIVGERRWGAISQGWHNLLPFIYQLHQQLALGTVGTWVFGIVALLWTLDCFVGAWLTLPPKAPRSHATSALRAARRGWQRWMPAWRVRWRGGAYKLNFDLHRAGGLWLWAMLFVLAWSSVAFNLNAVYSPVMKLFFATDDGPVPGPRPKADQIEPGIPWRQAHRMAQAHMAAEGRRLGFEVVEPQALSYDPHKALYRYSVRSSADVREKFGSTRLWFDANTGELRRSWLPSGRHAGDTITTWLVTLHIAQVWGLPFRVFVTLMGLVVAMLSITGVVVWAKKRRARLAAR